MTNGGKQKTNASGKKVRITQSLLLYFFTTYILSARIISNPSSTIKRPILMSPK